jgi:hypothetical protein
MGGVLGALTRRVVRVLIANSHKYVACNEMCGVLGLPDNRRIYDIVDALHALGSVAKRNHLYRWIGRPTLSQLPDVSAASGARPSVVSIAMAAQMVVRYFDSHPTAATTIWQGVTLRKAMEWKTRCRILYDVLSVFRGIGLISPCPERGIRAFTWTPGAALPLVTEEPKQQQKEKDMPHKLAPPPIPPPPLADQYWEDTRSNSGLSDSGNSSSVVLLEFETLLGPVQSGATDWLLAGDGIM